ncbi:hypothetical protein [Pannonibacter phragmitetus]|uniref:hypothetical protein n=1 Tax=Pannonibacter phragmitetus TaxID=121719 RepID=UPI003D2F17E3
MTIDLKALFGADAVEDVIRRLNSDSAFLAEARADLNAAVMAHYGVQLPLPLALAEGVDGWTVEVPHGDALDDSELDLVAGGSSQHFLNPGLKSDGDRRHV